MLAGLATSRLVGTEAANASALPRLNAVQHVAEVGGVGGAVIPGGGAVDPGGGAVVPGGGVFRGGGAVIPGWIGAVQAGAIQNVAAQRAFSPARDLNVAGLSGVAAGAVIGPIVRPGPVANAPVGAAVPIGAVVGDAA